MSAKKYVSPSAGAGLTSVIISGLKTPIVPVKFCNLTKPFYYPNSPQVPRFSVTCLFDAAKTKDFIKTIQDIEKNEKVESIIKLDTEKVDGEFFNTGNYLIKFQDRIKVPVYSMDSDTEQGMPPDLMELENELERGELISVMFNVLRYTKKNTTTPEFGISFVPTSIFYYPKE